MIQKFDSLAGLREELRVVFEAGPVPLSLINYMTAANSVSKQTRTHAMTVDVEDYFHVSAFADVVAPSDWENFPSRVVANTHCLLRLLAKHEVSATFFVLGWVAERFPELIRDIQRDGHEIGCHSYWHRLVYDLTPDEFRDDVVRARDVLENITGEAVRLYRAPSFSITPQSVWALDILADEGFEADSSIYPVYHDRYGYPQAEPQPHQILTSSGMIQEFPGCALNVCGLRLPISGGGYFRLYPERFFDFCVRTYLRRSDRPFMFYIHPWEVDPEQPRLLGSWKSQFRHYQNLATTERKLDRLLPRYPFGTMGQALAESQAVAKTFSVANGLYSPASVPTSQDLWPVSATS